MFATIRQFADLRATFTQLKLDPNGNDVDALLRCELSCSPALLALRALASGPDTFACHTPHSRAPSRAHTSRNQT